MKQNLFVAAIIILALGVYWLAVPNTNEQQIASHNGAPLVHVAVPDSFSETAQLGRTIFNENCAACHGPNASGRDGAAPPLVHKIYEPSHHGDESFQRAVALGVRQHHWPFGDMPAVEDLDRNDVQAIVAYVRALQVENGIN